MFLTHIMTREELLTQVLDYVQMAVGTMDEHEHKPDDEDRVYQLLTEAEEILVAELDKVALARAVKERLL